MSFHALGHAYSPHMGGIDLTFVLPTMPVVLLKDAYHDILSGYRLDPPSLGPRPKRYAVNNAGRDLARLAVRRR
jgi:hypothetical protein